ncbi:MAG: HD domain-containing protein [Desulfobacteraceae bacterium]|nr:MAG: HD domain-containing protein [Desulfobacteraceae bacterium]
MFTRNLSEEEVAIIRKVEVFVRDKHDTLQGHDYSHVLAVAHYAIEIAKLIPDFIDPFVLICGALFHDIGRVGTRSGRLHGLRGATIAEEYLRAIGIEDEIREQIVRIVVRHTETSMLPPENVAEKVVFDADDLDRLGLMGMLRGMMVGDVDRSMEDIIENRLEKRKKDYQKLHFQASRELGRELYEETLQLIDFIQHSLNQRSIEIRKLNLPV